MKTAAEKQRFSYDGPPGSRTQISRTGILRAIHYTKGPNHSY
ncbi:Protein of unknown function [Lactobacillus delbrueckii subsp. bulgaricus]|nr:Protein of unknown function [Lactobacillus delbrueckii subsp. bulgaricus]CDR74775.1 Protein of unknown function [Lactobacillus delbrueckii subsp. bulgaricus]